ncbi:UDP-rhamnose/UDP-galactose transporter 5 [Hondaea fermentalgiana]|uniref:UDP-rhamnose/UDP-galactose transporter 5 n=1 Tax=Hondaea fermentalgiana TaxID=2315210 RepID=A0A2R5GG77_9STRA|nr:UDP-rhamnose/UDP-galactose transporter 5 [Hondaea fermentalgiana]|eukprot:GBG29887.1 UDP-rhamnose/UDP-galactose transporter 5 [Hondaea fermentalgiana]
MTYPAWALVVGSIVSSVALVLVNKAIFASGFSYIFTLTTIHFMWTAGLLQILARVFGLFEVKYVSLGKTMLVSCFGVGSMCLMNFSLHLNSVGFYQMMKLCVVPCCLAIDAFMYGTFATRKIQVALVLILAGVGGATVTDLDLNLIGSLVGALAVVISAQYQTWMGRKQEEWKMSSQELALTLCTSQIFICGLLAATIDGPILFEAFRSGASIEDLGTQDQNSIIPQSSTSLAGLILLSCVLAISANIHAFALIGRTSAITFQVVGHGKTCLILIAHYAMYLTEGRPLSDLIFNLFGVFVALMGVALYSALKLKTPDEPDVLDLVLPSCLRWALEEPKERAPFVRIKANEADSLDGPEVADLLGDESETSDSEEEREQEEGTQRQAKAGVLVEMQATQQTPFAGDVSAVEGSASRPVTTV